MKVSIQDITALKVISPAALRVYACSLGWIKKEPYDKYSDVYDAKRKPEIVLPKTKRLGDYANVVSQLIKIFAKVVKKDELSVYHDLLTTDRDIVRIRVAGGDVGSLTMADSVELIHGAYDMLLATACSLWDAKSLYRASDSKNAVDLLLKTHFGQTVQGGFVVVILMPVIPVSSAKDSDDKSNGEEPIGRRLTMRLNEALLTVRKVTESMVTDMSDPFFEKIIDKGVSANLCEALARLITPFKELDINLSLAQTRLGKLAERSVKFAQSDAEILSEVARSFRDRNPEHDFRCEAIVERLKRDEKKSEGTITVKTQVDGRSRSVVTMLKQSDYEKAVSAHEKKATIFLEGDLERKGERCRLLNSSVVSVVS